MGFSLSHSDRPQMRVGSTGDRHYAFAVWALASLSWILGFPAFLFATGTSLVSSGSAVYSLWGLLSAAVAPFVFTRRKLPVALPVGTALWCGSLGFVDPVYRQTAPVILVALFAMTGLVYGRQTLLPVGALSIFAAAVSEAKAFEHDSTTRLTSLAMSLGIVAALVTISARHEEQLRAQIAELIDDLRDSSHTDELTQVLNRRGLGERVRHLQSSPLRRFVLMLIDLDLFKEVNDEFGHHGGDAVLKEVAYRLTTFADGTIVARLGGDEFVVIIEVESTHTIADLRDRLERQIGKPVHIPSMGTVPISASVGALEFDPASDLAEALAAADGQMYADKRTFKRRTSDSDVSVLERAVYGSAHFADSTQRASTQRASARRSSSAGFSTRSNIAPPFPRFRPTSSRISPNSSPD